jgi:iron(III) transport system substrate-binding protein
MIPTPSRTPGRWLTLPLLLLAAACGGGDAPGGTTRTAAGDTAGEVNVYTHRHYESDEQIFRRFTETTGIRVNVVTASADELITRLEAEGASSPADILITVDAGRLHRARERSLLQPTSSAILESAVPAHLRDPDGLWFGLTQRARVFVYATGRVDPSEMSTYEDLADPRWRGRILTRSSDNVYNQSLMASVIAAVGVEAAEAWARGLVANFARPPQGADRDQIRDVAAGVADLAIVNTYYLGLLANSDTPADREAAAAVSVFFPNQGEGERGTHVNVSGAGVTAHAPNRANAVRLLEFLVSEEAQQLVAEGNYEYPVREGVAWAQTLQGWGDFRQDMLNLARLGELNTQAVQALDRAGWR